MSSSNQAEIQASFTCQAEDFESRRMSFSKADYLAYVVSKIAPTKEATAEPPAGRYLTRSEDFVSPLSMVLHSTVPVRQIAARRERCKRCHPTNFFAEIAKKGLTNPDKGV